jgi:hypothetical protein
VFAGTMRFDRAGGPDNGALAALVETFVNNRLISARAEAEGVGRRDATVSRLETTLNRLWVDAYWSSVVRPALVAVDRSEWIAQAPEFGEKISLQQLVVNSRETAGRIRGRAMAGEDFDALVKANSTGLTAPGGGRIGYVGRDTDRYDADTVTRLFRMAPGDISDVIETPLGYSVFKLLDRKTGEQLKRDWVAANETRLVRQQEEKAWRKWKERLASSHRIIVNNRSVDEFAAKGTKPRKREELLNGPALEIDGIKILLRDVVDPLGVGVLHPEDAVSLAIDKRVEEFSIARDAKARGLAGKYPEIALKEKLLRENILAREYIRFKSGESATSARDREALVRNLVHDLKKNNTVWVKPGLGHDVFLQESFTQ